MKQVFGFPAFTRIGFPKITMRISREFKMTLLFISSIICLSSKSARANFGMFVNPMGVGSDTMMLPLPMGLEISYGVLDNLGVSASYSALQTSLLMIEAASLYNGKLFGNEVSSYIQWHSQKGVSNGLIAEAGVHYVTAKRFSCTKMDNSNIGCIATETIERHWYDASLKAGYGGILGKNNFVDIRYYGLIGYRFQGKEIRSIPIDARIGLGFSWPKLQ